MLGNYGRRESDKSNSSNDLLYQALVAHLTREQSTLDKLVETTEGLKDSLNQAMRTLDKNNADSQMEILKAKSSIMTLVQDKFVEKSYFEKVITNLSTTVEGTSENMTEQITKSNKDIVELIQRENRSIRREAKIVWTVVIVIAGSIAWLSDKGII